MKNKLKIFIFLLLGLLIIGIVSMKDSIQEKYLQKNQTQEQNPFYGTWTVSGGDTVWGFNRDHTGYVDVGKNAFFGANGNRGKTFFNYTFDNKTILIYNYIPCESLYYPCKEPPQNIEYKFIDRNTLIIKDNVLEKSGW